MRVSIGWVCAFAVAVAPSIVNAEQPTPVGVNIESRLVRWGNSSLRLTNHSRERHSLSVRPGQLGTIEFRPQRADLAPGATVDLDIGQLSTPDGIQVFHVVSLVNNENSALVNNEKGLDAGPGLHEVLEVSASSIQKTTYERAFLSKRVAIEGESQPARYDIGGGYMDAQPMAKLAFPSNREEPTVVVERVDEVDTFELSNMRLRQLPSPGTAAEGGALLRPMAEDATILEPAAEKGSERSAGISGVIKGKFMVRLPGATMGSVVFQAGWGWKVRAWQYLGKWFQVGSASVKSDGTWSIDLSPITVPNLPVRVEYQPANRFVQIQDANANVYTWADDWNLAPPVTDIGFRSADLTKTGNAPGIDILYQGATAVWRKFKKHGMNALRNEPIEITYPNTLATGKCQRPQNGMTIAWSCSQFADGKIWMIAAHANIDVAQHEIAHSIHSFYWNADMPSGSGIPHNASLCYNPGLALSEGFASFVSYWTQFDRTTVNPQSAFRSWQIENLGSGFCAGASNEAWVAATFWDMYDTVNEGTLPMADSWYFNNLAVPVSTLLGNPGKDSMTEYAPLISNLLGPTWTTRVVGLFWLNNMYLP